MNNYYTYAYLREDGTPYYIGKGKDVRIHSPNRRLKLPPKERRLFLKQNLTEEEAFKHEVYMIFVLGRKDLRTGILRNMTDGGEGSSGAVISEEHKRKISKFNKGKPSPNKGKTHSEETRRKISEAHKGKPRSEETKKKISEVQRGKILSEETKKKDRKID